MQPLTVYYVRDPHETLCVFVHIQLDSTVVLTVVYDPALNRDYDSLDRDCSLVIQSGAFLRGNSGVRYAQVDNDYQTSIQLYHHH